MAEENKNKWSTDISGFFDRLRGNDRIKVSTKTVSILQTPASPEEKAAKMKIQAISQYIRNKNWNRRHVEYFEEYRRMVTTFPIIKAAIDIYGEESTVKGDDGNVFKVVTENKNIKELLEDCYFKHLNLNTRGKLIVREICKFGNVYAYLLTRPKDGVVDMLFLPPDTIIREQMFDPTNLEDYRFNWYGGGSGATFAAWEVVHFKNTEDIEMEPYGSSVLRPIIDTWRRVVLIREALVIYRITRAPQRLLFKIGTDGMTPDEAFRFAQDMKKEITKKPLINPSTGEIDFKYNPISIEENYYLPISQENSLSDISTIDGASNLDAIEDYKIIKDDLFAGLKIPKSWLTFEDDLNSKGTLSEESIRFANTIQSIQAEFAEGIIHIGLVHLFMKGCSEEEMQSFSIEMNNPSSASEKKKLEIMQARLDIAKAAWDQNNAGLNLMSYVDVLRGILKFSDEEIKQTIKSQFNEKKIFWRLSQISENGFFTEPDAETQLLNLKKMGGSKEVLPVGFDSLVFESTALESKGLTEILKNKIDEEIKQMIPTILVKPSKKQIEVAKGSLTEELLKQKRDFGINPHSESI